MALKIRLRRMGRKKAPTYRIVVAESSSPRDGRSARVRGGVEDIRPPRMAAGYPSFCSTAASTLLRLAFLRS